MNDTRYERIKTACLTDGAIRGRDTSHLQADLQNPITRLARNKTPVSRCYGKIINTE